MDNEINIQEIMNDIIDSIKERNYDKEALDFEEIILSESAIFHDAGYCEEELMSEMKYLNHNWNNFYHMSTDNGNPVAVFLKRIIRKCTYFIVSPVVDFQNSYNASNVRCLHQMKEYIAQMEEYKQRVEKLEEELKTLKGK